MNKFIKGLAQITFVKKEAVDEYNNEKQYKLGCQINDTDGYSHKIILNVSKEVYEIDYKKGQNLVADVEVTSKYLICKAVKIDIVK